MSNANPGSPIVGAGVVLIDAGRVLLVRRRYPPRAGEWSLPGGKQQFGETICEAALRELKEETGLSAKVLGLIDVVDAIVPGADGEAGVHYVLVDFAARATGGKLRAGGDASEAAWHPFAVLPVLGLWAETLRIIEAARRFS